MTERVWENAVEMGLRNQELIVLANRHCRRMEFVQNGGRGMAEEATGLPINMREVRCPMARGGMAANLSFIVPDFYRNHCVGCDMRAPTGQVPNLATFIEDQDAAANLVAQREQARLDDLHLLWGDRRRAREALSTQLDDVMASAFADIAILDVDPKETGDRGSSDDEPDAQTSPGEERRSALARLQALASRLPEQFTRNVVEHACGLVAESYASPDLLDALRLVARARTEFAAPVTEAALTVLRRSSSSPAGRCLVDLLDEVDDEQLDEQVCRSLVILAGAPQGDGLRRGARATDPAPLLAAADRVPEVIVSTLRRMLPGPTSKSGLLVPPGAQTAEPVTPFEIGSAAGAIRVLAPIHPSMVEDLVAPLVLQLSADVFDAYDHEGQTDIERALAVMLVCDVGTVLETMAAAGVNGSDELCTRLVHVLTTAEDLVEPEPRWHRAGDPTPTAERADAVREALFEFALQRIGGDWGHHASAEATDLVESLVQARPAAFFGKLPVLLGMVLDLIEQADDTPTSSLEVVGGHSAWIRALEAEGRRVMRNSAVLRLLSSTKALARVDPVTVIDALRDLLTEERDSERRSEVAYRFIGTLGDIGNAHGDEPGVLQLVLPQLHTYMVGTEVLPRAAALDAWVKIARRHQLPSSLVDLLPALTSDAHIAVAQAVLRATVALDWPDAATPRLMLHAVTMLKEFNDGSQPEILKESIAAVLETAANFGHSDVLEAAEGQALEAAGSLNSYDLEAVLRHRWTPATMRSPLMAALRLRLARDPQINDRFNRRDDDPELVSLLAVGPGLLGLPQQSLIDAATELGPDRPLAAAEFVEVAWRSARPGVTVAVSQALVDITPNQPAYAVQRTFFTALAAAARADTRAMTGSDWELDAEAAKVAVAELRSTADAPAIAAICESITATLRLRRLLMRTEPGDGDHAATLRSRAQQFAEAGQSLASSSMKATATGQYLRAVASLCTAVRHSLEAEAAELDADVQQAAASRTAARRWCEQLVEETTAKLGADDPAAGPLVSVASMLRDVAAGGSLAEVLAAFVKLPLPVPAVIGARGRGGTPAGGAFAGRSGTASRRTTPVAVALASLDGNLITGPAVLKAARVYQLAVRVQTDQWPEWATQLDLEILSHLTPAEITVPAFSWARADSLDDGETFEQSGSVVVRYSIAAGAASPPLLVRLTWRGQKDGQPTAQVLDVAGHRELRLRPYDESRDRATDYPVFDERLLGMYDRLARTGYDDDQLQAFCRLFTSICRVGLQMTWEKKYRRGVRITEREFHNDIHDRLMADPELGGRIERGSPLALGFLDVRHDGITAELKVERQTPVTKERAPKYMGQPTQYAAANGSRLSILTVLDMSPKVVPIGTPENYLFELVPQLHGLENPEAPSLVAVLVINGSLPTPSSWSRRKTPTAAAADRTPDAGQTAATEAEEPSSDGGTSG